MIITIYFVDIYNLYIIISNYLIYLFLSDKLYVILLIKSILILGNYTYIIIFVYI